MTLLKLFTAIFINAITCTQHQNASDRDIDKSYTESYIKSNVNSSSKTLR